MPSALTELRSYADDANTKSDECVYTTSNGVPISHSYATQRAGNNGPLLLQDFHLVDLLSHFDRERIPERVVHAKGAGAHGVFECTDPLDDLSMADCFSAKGKKCPVTVRFSTVGGESGSHDCNRDPRGFSIKMKTAEGNHDFVFNATPVFFLRDPAKFPHFIHTQKRDPATHLNATDDSTRFWDYLSENPEAIHQVCVLFGPRGIPDGYRKMHGYSGHTFKLVNKDGSWVYCQFHWKSAQGFHTLSEEEAAEKSPDYSIRDLFEAIDKGDFPSWDLHVQTMTAEEAEKAWEEKKINVFDLTHVWPQKEYPLRKVGRMTLNENPKNYFAEVEQAAFNPAHIVPGIQPSADPVLQSRLFSYPDTHRHRIGVNYQQLPVNAPQVPYKMANFQRDGQMAYYNQGGRQDYLSSLDPIKFDPRKIDLDRVHGVFSGKAIVYMSAITPHDFKQPRELYTRVFSDNDRAQFVKSLAGHMARCRDKKSVSKMISIFHQVDADLAKNLAKATKTTDYETDMSKLTFLGTHNGFADGDNKFAMGNTSLAGLPAKNGAPEPGHAAGSAAVTNGVNGNK